MHIEQTWKNYFQNHHEGLGTTYERFILHQFFQKIQKATPIETVLEIPAFGMTGISGINSLWWATQGKSVTLVDHDPERIENIKKVWQEMSLKASVVLRSNDYSNLPFADNAFDLCWNFAALDYVPNLPLFLKELGRISKKSIFICIPNSENLFNRRLFKNQHSTNQKKITADGMIETLRDCGWQITDRGYLDVPPWPDIAMNKEDLLEKFDLTWLARKWRKDTDHQICILDYFNGKQREMEQEILKYNWLENSPRFFQKLWAHHQYFIFNKEK